MKHKVLIPIMIASAVLVIALAVFFSTWSYDTTLDFTFRDKVSKQWVWDATVTLQDRIIRSFYQSDRAPRTFTFTGLQPGTGELVVTAPSYITQTVPVSLKRGKNEIEEPIEMVGYEIPELDHFIIFEDQVGNDIPLEIRPVGSNGRAVTNHPCVDIWIGCIVSEQMIDGQFVQEPTESGSVRGNTLFQGELLWDFDSSPETIFRYSAAIPGKEMTETSAPYLVIDYIIIVPDPRKITNEEVEEIMTEAVQNEELEEIFKPLQEEEERLDYYYFTNWNVERP